MIISSAAQFNLPCLGTCLAQCLNSVLNVRALVGAFNQHKALEGAFSVTVKTDGLFETAAPRFSTSAQHNTHQNAF